MLKFPSLATHASRYMDLLLLALLWSPSGICLKLALQEIKPLSLISLTLLFATLCLWSFLKLSNISVKQIKRSEWIQGSLVGLLCNGLPFTLQSIATQYIETTWLGILTSTIPIFTALISYCLLSHNAFSLKTIIGIIMGLTGTLLLFLSQYLIPSPTNQTLGILIATAAAISYGFGLTYAMQLPQTSPSLRQPFIHVASTLVYLLPLTLILEGPTSFLTIPSPQTSLCIGILAVPATTFAFIIYYRILHHSGALFLSLVNYLLPLLKVSLGVLLLHEALSSTFLLAAGFIVLGIALTCK